MTTATYLPDPANSSAVLFGSYSFRHQSLEDLPAVSGNLHSLHDLLISPEILGLPEDRCRIMISPPDSGPDLSPEAVLTRIEEAAQSANDTFILYYAGHGETCGTEDKLFLTLAGSDPNIDYTMIQFDHIRGILHRGGHISRKVVILDCCFGARAFGGRMGHQSLQQLAAPKDVVGTVVMTSAAENRLALAPVGARYTAFTGELIAILRDGITTSEAVLSVDAIYSHLWNRMRKETYPEPQLSMRNLGRQIGLARNRAAQGGADLRMSDSQAAMLVSQAEADRILNELARRRPSLSPNLQDAEQWMAVKEYLMSIVLLFDRRPFVAYRPPGEERQPVPLLEGVLPRLVELSDVTGVSEWESLADQIYSAWVSEEIAKQIPDPVQSETADLFETARNKFRKEQRKDVRLQLLDTALALTARSAGALLGESGPVGQLIIEETATPISQIPSLTDNRPFPVGCLISFFGAPVIFVALQGFAHLSFWIALLIAIPLWVPFFRYQSSEERYNTALPETIRAHYEAHKPWKSA
jgi:hypothetical protein